VIEGEKKMKKYLIIFFMLMFMATGLAFSDIVSFRVGYFIPRAQSDLWDIEFENLDLTKSNFQNSSFSFAYEYFLTNEISFQFSVDGYTKKKVGTYLDYVGYSDLDGDWAYPDIYEGDFYPSHVFSVSNTPVQLSLKLTPMGRTGKIIPYVGGGAGMYIWTVTMQGDMIDFSDEWWDTVEQVDIYPIYEVDAREESKISFGFHAFGGFMVPLANRISIAAEFKYNIAKGSFSGDQGFEGFEPFDLSGYQISIGINYWF
jgi:hypothetical protein